jgi:hypothetical protein
MSDSEIKLVIRQILKGGPVSKGSDDEKVLLYLKHIGMVRINSDRSICITDVLEKFDDDTKLEIMFKSYKGE